MHIQYHNLDFLMKDFIPIRDKSVNLNARGDNRLIKLHIIA